MLELLNVAFGWPEVGLSGLRKHARIKAKTFFKAVNQKKAGEFRIHKFLTGSHFLDVLISSPSAST